VTDIVTTYAGRMTQWDVVNESYDNHDVTDLVGDIVMVEAFNAAVTAEPVAKLFINDCGILEGGSMSQSHRDDY
jgi:endo-1,4-beta-xylanase